MSSTYCSDCKNSLQTLRVQKVQSGFHSKNVISTDLSTECTQLHLAALARSGHIAIFGLLLFNGTKIWQF